MADFLLESLRGGLDDFTPVSALAKDACTVAENVEFFYSTLGERRAGCALLAAGLPVGITGDALLDAAVWAFRHQPTKNETDDELWVLTRDTDNTPKMYRLTSAGWGTVTLNSISANDVPLLTNNDGYHIYGQSLHGKLFLAFKSNVDRLHVWDGTVLRRAGLASSSAPTVANSVGAGAYAATLRYYRTRSVIRSGTTVLVRSEPSASSAGFTPDGAHASAVVTRAAVIGEAETDWEVEVSLDNITFYRLSTVAIATTTYSDSAVTTTYSSNIASDPVGTYGLIPSVTYLAADDDRLLLGGSRTTAADGSAIQWTPVGTDPSPGPDERLNATTSPRLDLDGLEGGDISALSRVVSGSLLAHKTTHIYKLLRTGQLVGAYEALPLTKTRGAFPRSVVEASDEAGRPSQFFLDPQVGPMRYGANGLEFVGYNIHTLWRRVNKSAIVPCHGVFYPDKHQLWYWLALDGASYPNAIIKLQTNEVVTGVTGARRGWATVPSPCRIADARCSTMFVVNIQTGDLTTVPFIGKQKWTVGATTVTDIVQRCDTGTTDAFTLGDTAAAYTAKVRTRAFFLANILNQAGIKSAALLGSAGSRVLVTLRRNYGIETKAVSANMTASSTESYVIAHLDAAEMSELYALELEFADDPANLTQWQLFQFAVQVEAEQTP